jgi:hypothetical protein
MESERKDALATSARAMPASAEIISSARSGESGYAVSPNHPYLNRRESVCRESGVNNLKESFPKTLMQRERIRNACAVGRKVCLFDESLALFASSSRDYCFFKT